MAALGAMTKWYVRCGELREMVLCHPNVSPQQVACCAFERAFEKSETLMLSEIVMISPWGFCDDENMINEDILLITSELIMKNLQDEVFRTQPPDEC